MAAKISSPWAGLDLDTAIRLRWALRDIQAMRTKLTPVSPSDLNTLIEMGMVEMRDDAPMLTNEGHQGCENKMCLIQALECDRQAFWKAMTAATRLLTPYFCMMVDM
jgi:hypothetical protein